MKMLIVCFAEHLAMISREMKRITSLNELLMAVKMTSVNLMLQILAGPANPEINVAPNSEKLSDPRCKARG